MIIFGISITPATVAAALVITMMNVMVVWAISMSYILYKIEKQSKQEFYDMFEQILCIVILEFLILMIPVIRSVV